MVTIALNDEERDLLVKVVADAEAQFRHASEDETDYVNRGLYASYARTLQGIRRRLLGETPAGVQSR
jgi:hypothetical protein